MKFSHKDIGGERRTKMDISLCVRSRLQFPHLSWPSCSKPYSFSPTYKCCFLSYAFSLLHHLLDHFCFAKMCHYHPFFLWPPNLFQLLPHSLFSFTTSLQKFSGHITSISLHPNNFIINFNPNNDLKLPQAKVKKTSSPLLSGPCWSTDTAVHRLDLELLS